MKLNYNSYCNSEELLIDGKKFDEYSIEEQKGIVHKIINNDKCDTLILREFISNFTELLGECENTFCEQCQDYNYKFSLQI